MRAHFFVRCAAFMPLSLVLSCSGSDRVSTGGTRGDAGDTGGSGVGGVLGTGGSARGGAGTGGAGIPPLEPTRIRGGDPYQYYLDLEVMGDGLESLEGRVVTVRIGDSPAYRLASAQARVVGGRFSLSLPQTLEVGLYKEKIILFDTDGDGHCGPGDQVSVDHSSSSSAPGVAIRMFSSDGTTIHASAGASLGGALGAPSDDLCRRMEICGSHDPQAEGTRPFMDMKVVGSGFDSYEYRAVQLLTRSTGDAALRGIGRGTVIGGRFMVYLPNGYGRRAEQEILWFVDVDGDGKCNASAGDHLGYAAAAGLDPAGNEAVTVSVSDDPAIPAGGVDVCAAMQPLSIMAVTGSGFTAHEGALIYFFTRTANGAPLAGGLANIAAGGGVSFSQRPSAYERNVNQQVLWFVDAQRSPPAAVCDLKAGDHVGYLLTDALDPAGSNVVNVAISDNHLETVGTTNEDICAVMNGCR